jgi:NAD kinase
MRSIEHSISLVNALQVERKLSITNALLMSCYTSPHTHSLSFRPLVFPDSVVFRCDIPLDGRAEGVVSFDGKYSQPLKRGDSLVVKVSTHLSLDWLTDVW